MARQHGFREAEGPGGASRDGGGPLQRYVERFAFRAGEVGEAEAGRLRARQRLAQEREAAGGAKAHAPGQGPQSGEVRHQADAAEGADELRILRRHHDIARRRQPEPGTSRRALHRGEHHLGSADDEPADALEALHPVAAHHAGTGHHGLDVAAGAERPAGTGDDDGTHSLVGHALGEVIVQRLPHGREQGVAPLGRVEGEEEDGAALLGADRGGVGGLGRAHRVTTALPSNWRSAMRPMIAGTAPRPSTTVSGPSRAPSAMAARTRSAAARRTMGFCQR